MTVWGVSACGVALVRARIRLSSDKIIYFAREIPQLRAYPTNGSTHWRVFLYLCLHFPSPDKRKYERPKSTSTNFVHSHHISQPRSMT